MMTYLDWYYATENECIWKMKYIKAIFLHNMKQYTENWFNLSAAKTK